MSRLIELFLAELRSISDKYRNLAYLKEFPLEHALALRRYDKKEVLRDGRRADKGEINAVTHKLLRRHSTRNSPCLRQDDTAQEDGANLCLRIQMRTYVQIVRHNRDISGR